MMLGMNRVALFKFLRRAFRDKDVKNHMFLVRRIGIFTTHSGFNSLEWIIAKHYIDNVKMGTWVPVKDITVFDLEHIKDVSIWSVPTP